MRLDKYIANVTDLSRKEVKRTLKAGIVTVNGQTIKDPASSVGNDAMVTVEGQVLRPVGFRYFMLNKPEGYVCAAKDRQNMTVLELFDEDNVERLHVAGRLDIDTTGLVLLTDDGQWSHRITSPKHECLKTYYVETVDPIDESLIALFQQGLQLKGERYLTKPACLDILHEQAARLTISEGKYHQVKRMFAAVGNRVELLNRESIGQIHLDPDLALGAYRALTVEEAALV